MGGFYVCATADRSMCRIGLPTFVAWAKGSHDQGGHHDRDLEPVDTKFFDGRTVELTYRPTLHVGRG